MDALEVSALGERGWFLRDDFLTHEQVLALRAEADALHATGRFTTAGVGRSQRSRDGGVRSDEHLWLDPEAGSVFAALHRRLAELGQSLRREAYLGIEDFDLQLARYDAGDAYARHRDAFRGRNERRATAIVYLNPAWQPQHGGQLRLHLRLRDSVQPEPVEGPSTALGANGEVLDLEPRGGRLVVFLSEAIEHEVLPAQALRYAATAWYRGPKS